MCRLYGFRANERTKVECSLVYAQNALLNQSRLDARGSSHADGWGVGYYDNRVPAVERGVTAAFEGGHFSTTAERVYSKTVLAHVRNATVGGASLANTHPFSYRHWVFAHNGTVRPFDALAPQLESEISLRLADLRVGTTDSELCFLWLLSRLEQIGVDLEDAKHETENLGSVIGQAVAELTERSAALGPERPAMLNFILTDGLKMVATRWHRSLYCLEREGVHDCEICGIPHIDHRQGVAYRAVVIASEPISDEAWQEVPNGSLIEVGADLERQVLRFN